MGSIRLYPKMLCFLTTFFVLFISVSNTAGQELIMKGVGQQNTDVTCLEEEVLMCGPLLIGQIQACMDDGFLGAEIADCVESLIGGCLDCIPCYVCLCQIIQMIGLDSC